MNDILLSLNNLNYKAYCAENKIDALLNIDLNQYGNIESKQSKSIYESVDPGNELPFIAELDDLIRLHYIVRSRKVLTVLEFGVGKSTIIFADAIKKNKIEYEKYVTDNIRRYNSFEVHSVDAHNKWIGECKKNLPSSHLPYVTFYQSNVEMTTFNGRICTAYKSLPNILPDLIYLDAPDQFCVKNNVRGISTASQDRVPLSADILMFEHFLLPGTLIIVDGRTANARFLKSNLQRKWSYTHIQAADIHLFLLDEMPLGECNKQMMQFMMRDSP